MVPHQVPGLCDHLVSQPDLTSHRESLASYLTSLLLSFLHHEVGVVIVPSAGKLGNPHELSKHFTNAWNIVNAQTVSVVLGGKI